MEVVNFNPVLYAERIYGTNHDTGQASLCYIGHF